MAEQILTTFVPRAEIAAKTGIFVQNNHQSRRSLKNPQAFAMA